MVNERDGRVGNCLFHRERDREGDILGAGETLDAVILVELL